MRLARRILGAAGQAGAGTALAASLALPVRADEPAAAIAEAVRCLRTGQAAQAAALGERLATDVFQPHARAWLLVAQARQAQGRYEDAALAYRRFLGVCGSAELRRYVLEQAELCERQGRAYDELAPPSASLSAQQLATLSRVDEQSHVAGGEHFVVYSRNAALSELLVRHAEQALRRITQTILHGTEYPHSVEVHVHPTLRDFRAQARAGLDWAGGGFELSVQAGGHVRRVVHLTQLDESGSFNPVMLDRVLPHELCHLVLVEWFGDARCPLYLHEGLAMLAEYGDQDERLLLAGAAMATNRSLSLDHLLAREQYEQQEIAVFYAQAYSFTAYLHERLSPRQFRELLGHVQSGCSLSESLHRTLLLVYDEQFMTRLEKAWQDDAVAQAQYLSALKDLARRM